MTEQAAKLADMSNAEFYLECRRAILHMTKKLDHIVNFIGGTLEKATDDTLEVLAESQVKHALPVMMDGLGDILNELDATEPGEETFDAVFQELYRRSCD